MWDLVNVVLFFWLWAWGLPFGARGLQRGRWRRWEIIVREEDEGDDEDESGDNKLWLICWRLMM
jgi:hypothetical protein